MLRRDDQLRLSGPVQNRYRQCGEDVNGRIRVTEDVQRQVVREHGFARNVRDGVELLRSAKALWPNDTEIRDAADLPSKPKYERLYDFLNYGWRLDVAPNKGSDWIAANRSEAADIPSGYAYFGVLDKL